MKIIKQQKEKRYIPKCNLNWEAGLGAADTL